MSAPDIEIAYMLSRDATRIFYRYHPAEDPIAMLVFVHGFAEHSGRYLHVFQAMNAHGFSCLAVDYRGHGRAAGVRGFVEEFDEYLDDVDCAIYQARVFRSDLPVFLVGHSQGGLIAATHCLDRKADLAGIVLSSPAMRVGMPVPIWKDLLGKLMGHLFPTVSIPTGLDSKLVSRDPDVVTAYDSDPLLLRKATAGWYLEFLNAQARALELAPTIGLPALVMQAGADGLVSPEATERFFAAMGSEDKTFKSYENFYHELFNEVEKEQVFDDVATWLKERLG